MAPQNAAILDLLSSDAMRHEILPFAQAREDFRPYLCVETWQEIQSEIVRFVGHVSRLRFASKSREPWPVLLAEREADELLEAVYGPAPRRAVVSAVRQHGIRAVLDRLTRHLQHQRLQTYMEMRVLPQLADVEPPERYDLAQQYLEHLRETLGGGLADGIHFVGPTADTLGWWRDTLREHTGSLLERI